MAEYTFLLPDIGEGIAEAEIVAWHVKPGDTVEADARLADMMTDKATVEMESPVTGQVLWIAGEVGDVVAIGAPLVVLAVDDADTAAEPEVASIEVTEAAVPNEQSRPVTEKTVDAPSQDNDGSPTRADTKGPTVAAPRVLASPTVRRRAAELGIDLAQLTPVSEGRVRHGDLDAFLAYDTHGGYRAPGRRAPDEQIRVIGLRRRIAENMAASKRNIPHFSYVEECDVTALEVMRTQLNTERGDKPRLTMLPLLITAICRTVPDFPMLNARYDDEAGVVTRHGAVHLGMATQTPAGLMVPVIRNAESRNMWQLASEIMRLAEACRDGGIRPEELTGSTLTVTSLGPLGGVATTPVVNRPEVAIIGPNRIVERPMFVPNGFGGERIEKRKLMNVSISCDHRVVDGWDAASFVQALKAIIETPVRLLS